MSWLLSAYPLETFIHIRMYLVSSHVCYFEAFLDQMCQKGDRLVSQMILSVGPSPSSWAPYQERDPKTPWWYLSSARVSSRFRVVVRWIRSISCQYCEGCLSYHHLPYLFPPSCSYHATFKMELDHGMQQRLADVMVPLSASGHALKRKKWLWQSSRRENNNWCFLKI